MQKLGLPATWGFGEIYGFDEELLMMVPQPCIAVIANVERLKKEEDKAKGDADTQTTFYMKQTGKLDNACGVIACLHGIYNNMGDAENQIKLAADSVLAKHFDSTKE